MSDINTCTFTGRLTRDPELKTFNTQKGDFTVASFAIAVNEYFGGKENTTFVELRAYDKLAGVVGDYLKKGAEIAVGCRFKVDVKGEGADRKSYSYFRVIDLKLPSKGGNGSAGNSSPAPAKKSQPQKTSEPSYSGGAFDSDEDIPF